MSTVDQLVRMRLLALILLLGWAGSMLFGQTSTAVIVGTVRDSSGAVVPGAHIVVVNTGTNVEFPIDTDNTGSYYVPSLIPGRYQVTASKSGFAGVSVSDVLLEVGQTVRVDLVLRVGQITQTVKVEATTQMVQSDNATVGQVIERREVQELPLNGRDFTNLMKLNVGVTEVSGGANTGSVRMHGLNGNFRNVSVDGARPMDIGFLIDGISDNDNLFQTAAVVPPIDAIQEFKLQNGMYSAEFGFGSAQVNIALRSGTNDLHGSAWDFLRNSAFEPKNPYFHTSTPLRQNQFGLTLGGPVYLPKIYKGKNRTFFFGSWESGRRRTSSFGLAQVPTAQERQGNFSDWPTQLYNPLTTVSTPSGGSPITRAPFVNNQIPSSLFAPQSVSLLQYYPLPNISCTLPCNNYTRGYSLPLDVDTFTTRVDHNVKDSDRIFGQFVFQDQLASNSTTIPLSGTKETQNSRQAGLGWTHIFGPRTLNEARVGFSRLSFLNNFEDSGGATNYAQQAGLVNLNENPNTLPHIIPGTQYAAIGTSGTVPFVSDSNTIDIVDAVTLTRGKHSIKVGGEIRRHLDRNSTADFENGALYFGGAYTAANPTLAQAAGKAGTGNGIADFLLGYLNNAGGAAAQFYNIPVPTARLRYTDFTGYVNDDFRVSSRITLNLGLRWEYRTPFEGLDGGGTVFDFNYPGGRSLYADKTYTQLFNNPILAACCAPNPLIPPDKHDFAPRIGLAWRPLPNSNRLAVRAGYGIFYDIADYHYYSNSVVTPVDFLEPTLPNPSGLEATPPVDIRNLFPTPYSIAAQSFPPPYCKAPSQSVINSQGIITQVNNACQTAGFGEGDGGLIPGTKTPYTQQWALNVQFEPVKDLLLEVGYQGSHGLRLPGFWAFNQDEVAPPSIGNPNNGLLYQSQCPAGTFPATCSPVQNRAPYYNFNANSSTIAGLFQSKYNAMTAKVDKRFSTGLQFRTLFTWSRSLDDDSEISSIGTVGANFAQDAYHLKNDWGPSGFDQTLRFVSSFVYELPFGEGKALLNRRGLLNRMLGGWQANGIYTLASGQPLTVLCNCGDRAQIGNVYNGERANLNGNPLPSGFNQTYTHWFDTSVFSTPALGTQGTEGRDILRTTHQNAMDFSLFKNNVIRERMNLQFRAEFFNLFSNHFYNPVAPNANLQATNFGSLLPAGADPGYLFNPRVYQFALRLVF